MKQDQTASFLRPTDAISAATGTKLQAAPFNYGFVQKGRTQSGGVAAEMQLSRVDGSLLAFAEQPIGGMGLEVGARVLVGGTMRTHRGIRYLHVATICRAVDVAREWKLNLLPRDLIADFDSFMELREIIWRLDAQMRAVVCEVLTHDDIAAGFFQSPSSVAGHHAFKGGNLRHAVEVATIVIRLIGDEQVTLDRDLAIASAILHDVGKALEYEAKSDNEWRMSLRGKLIGHKLTGYEYVAAAVRDCGLAPERALSLLHCLSATNAPAYLGMRSPACLEAQIVSMADKLSGQTNLFSQLQVAGSMLGRSHPHLTERPLYPANALQIDAPRDGGKP